MKNLRLYNDSLNKICNKSNQGVFLLNEGEVTISKGESHFLKKFPHPKTSPQIV